MSRTSDLVAAARRRVRGEADAGFTLIEVIVALTLFAIVSSAAASMIITGLRTSVVTKLDTGAKNLSQERLEIMRNLPFHIDRDPAATTPDSSDLLDIYYRNKTAAASSTTNGFVAACGAETATCSGRAAWDPPSGSFYRYVLDPVPGYAKYKQYVATQFLNDQRVPLAPGTYDSQTSGIDSGPSQFVGVTVTTYWTAGKLSKSLQLQTLISAGRPGATQVVAQGRAAAVKFSGGLDATRLLTMELGIVNMDGALAVGATSAASAQGGTADVTQAQHIDGAKASVQAPPNPATAMGTDTAKDIMEGTSSIAHFGATTSSNVSALVTGGLPTVGSSGSPVTGQVGAQGVGSTPVWFTPLPSPAAHLSLQANKPLMWIDQTTGGATVAQGTGYIASTSGTGHSVTSNVTGSALRVKMFSTTFAPDGVVQVKLTSSSLNCTTTGSVSSATLTYSATVWYWNGTGYTQLDLSQAQSTDPLASVNLATTQVGTDSSGAKIYLGEYVAGWSSLTTTTIASGKTIDGDFNRVEAAYDGIVKVTAAAMRPGDPTSTSGLLAGSLSCIAEDNR